MSPFGRGDPQPSTRTSGEELAGLPAGELLALCSAELRYHAKAKNRASPTGHLPGLKSRCTFFSKPQKGCGAQWFAKAVHKNTRGSLAQALGCWD